MMHFRSESSGIFVLWDLHSAPRSPPGGGRCRHNTFSDSHLPHANVVALQTSLRGASLRNCFLSWGKTPLSTMWQLCM